MKSDNENETKHDAVKDAEVSETAVGNNEDEGANADDKQGEQDGIDDYNKQYLSISQLYFVFIYSPNPPLVLSVCLSIYLSDYLTIYLSIYISIYLSIFSPEFLLG